MKKISIITPCYNEEENICELYSRIVNVMEQIEEYSFELLFIDNASEDRTVDLLRELVASDDRVRVIVNTRNFGHIRSPYWGILNTAGCATIYLASDLQDPPELIPNFLKLWEKGYKVVLAAKPVSRTNKLMHILRQSYYSMLSSMSDVEIVKDSTGFGLYDECVIAELRKINDPYPFLRGLVAELGFSTAVINFEQPRRQRGITKNNAYTLYDIAVLGFISHSILPIRLASFFGLFVGMLSVLVGAAYFVAKLVWWDAFPMGVGPVVVGLFLMLGIVLVFVGILGEYIGLIYTHIRNRPIVVERERINM